MHTDNTTIFVMLNLITNYYIAIAKTYEYSHAHMGLV